MTTNKHRMILAGALAAVLMVAQVCAQGFGVRSVGSVQQHNGPMQVTVVFTDPADPVTAVETSRYAIPGATVTAAAMMTDLPDAGEAGNGEGGIAPRVLDNQCVVLSVTGLGSAATALTVTGVKNASGAETFTGSKNFVPSGYSWCDVGLAPDGTRKVGKVIALSDEGFDIFNNGRTAWAGQDEFTFVFKQMTGAFDLSNRVEFVDYGSRWSRAGLMVREDLDIGAAVNTFGRYCTAHVNPVRAWIDNAAGTMAGNNQYESNYRDTIDSATTEGGGAGAPSYPSAWVRLERTAAAPDTINAYYSIGGSGTWTQFGGDTGGRILNLDTDGVTEKPLANAVYVGPAFCLEAGNISDQNPPEARQRYYLTQIRFKELAVPTVRNFDPNPTGFAFNIVDSPGGSAANPATVTLTVNGTLALATTFTAVKSGDTTRVVYRQAAAFPVGSANAVIVEFRDDANQVLSSQQQWTATYVAIPASYAITTASTPGMVANTYQIDYARAASDPPENRLATAEQQQARGIVDESGVPYPNVAAAASTPVTIVNWEQEMIDIDSTPEDGPDNFNTLRPAAPRMAVPNEYIPGIPGTGYDNSHTGAEVGRLDNNIVAEVLTYLNLTAGAYRMGVNSDDGFKVSCAPGAPDVTGLILGSFNGGRGAGDTLFDFYVDQAGYYPVRLLWWEGSGGGNVEWFTEDLATGERYLVNGSESQAVKGYRTGQNRAYVKSIVPANNYENTEIRPTIRVEIANGTTSAVAGQTRLVLDGVEVVSGGGNVISWTPSADYNYGSTHSGQLFWTENTTPATTWTIDYRFTIKAVSAATLPPTTFWIEMEDFDYGNGQSLPSASVMPYAGGEYEGASLPTRAVYNVDYWRQDRGPIDAGALGGYVYRTDIPGWVTEPTVADYFVPMGGNTGGVNSERPGSPVFTVTANFKSAWSGGGWYNYTRTLPQGIYGAFLVASHWNATDDAADGQINSRLAKVVSGVGTATQTLQELGTFSGPGAGFSTASVFTPLETSPGDIAAFKANGKTTFRLTITAGDTDYFALAPLSGVPPKITGSYPAANAQVARDDSVRVTIEDFSTSVVLNSVKLFFDSVDVTAQATITKPADITTITFDPAGLMAVGAHSYRVDYNDSASKAFTTTVNFTVVQLGVPGQFLIEAEDFNNAGQAVAAASTMPYLGNAFNGQGGVFDVDYHSAETLAPDNSDGQGWTAVYRTGPPITPNFEAPLNDNLGGTLGRMRGATWQMNVNYKIGWVGAGDWMNYTRNIPAGYYEVWAALSHGDAPTSASRITASLDLVTGDVSQPDAQQTKTPLGIFNAPPTGGWGANALIPMTDTAGGPVKVVSLPAPPTTLRFSPSSGDFDYFVLFPSSAPPEQPEITGIVQNPNGSITITWTGAGIVQYATSLTNPNWTDVVGSTSPYTFNPADLGNPPVVFGRIKQ